MESSIGQFIFMYLLLPIIGTIIAVVMVYVGKKNELLSNKKAIFYFLLTCLMLALFGLLGFIDYWFMPYAYICLQIVYFLLGWYNMKLLLRMVPNIKGKPFYVEFLVVFVTMFVGLALFSLIFNLCNELQYGLWASTCLIPFIFPCVFRQAYHSYLNIPLEVYKVWNYGNQTHDFDTDSLDFSKVLVVELEMFKQSGDKKAQNIKAKSSEDIPFGVWFKIFIDDYNKRTPQSPITYSDYDNSYGWIFYVNSMILGRKKYIDPDLTFSQNKIREENVIIAKRTKNEQYSN